MEVASLRHLFIGLHKKDPPKVDLNQSKREPSFQAGKPPYSLGMLLYEIRKIKDKNNAQHYF
jgi:hypothetical protein